MTSLRGLHAEHLGDPGKLVVEFLDAGGELVRPANIDDLAGGFELVAMVGSLATAARTSAAICSRTASGMPRGPKMPPMLSITSAGKPASATVGTSGALGARRRPVTANTLTLPACISGVTIASDDDNSWMRFSVEIVWRLQDVAIGHLRHLQSVALEEARHQEIGIAVGGRPVEFAGIGAHQLDELAQ